MKKIVAHIRRIVTMTTIKTVMNVSVSDDDLNAPAIPPREPSIDLTIPEGGKNEKTRDDSIGNHSAQRKSARCVRASRRSKRKSSRADG
jgi:hypothetical protein